jgi:hypothetical protein
LEINMTFPSTAKDFAAWLEKERANLTPEQQEAGERVLLSLQSFERNPNPNAQRVLAKGAAPDVEAFIRSLDLKKPQET